MKLDGDFLLVGFSAVSSVQCFDTVGWVTGRASGVSILAPEVICSEPGQTLSNTAGEGQTLRLQFSCFSWTIVMYPCCFCNGCSIKS